MTIASASQQKDVYGNPAVRHADPEIFMMVFGFIGLLLGLVNLIVTGLLSWLNLDTNGFSLQLYGGLYGLTLIVLVVVQLSFVWVYLRNHESWGIPETLFTLCLTTSIVLAGWAMLDAFVGKFDWGVSLLHLVLCIIGLGCFFGLKEGNVPDDNYHDYDI